MSEDVITFDLDDTEAEKFALQKKELQENSALAAQKAYRFAETMAEMVNAYNKGQEAEQEYLRLMKRAAKARARQPEDIVDLDIQGKKIVFKKTPKELAREKEDDETDAVPEGS